MMNCLTRLILNLTRDRRGVTALEYGLIASLIGLAIVASVTTFATKLGAEFTLIGTKI